MINDEANMPVKMKHKNYQGGRLPLLSIAKGLQVPAKAPLIE